MKKFFKILGVIPIILMMMLGLSACFGDGNNDNNLPEDPPPHVHEYANDYSYDETYHWYSPICGDTTEVKDKAKHILVPQILREPTCFYKGSLIYQCRDCDYRSEKQEVDEIAHKYATTWTCLAEGHAHLCGVCKQYDDVIPHEYENGKCKICGYTDGNRNLITMSVSDSTGSYVRIDGIKDESEENIVIPSHIAGIAVWKIADNAFSNNMNLKTITLSDNVQIIGDKAFEYCRNLTTVNIGKGIKSIGSRAFCVCDNLETINFPEGLTTIKNSAFAECRKLQQVDLPSTVKAIEQNAFSNCRSLTKLTLPNEMEEINSIIENCNNLIYNEFSNACYIGSKNNPYLVLVKQKDNSITDIIINPECKFIYYDALSGCSELTSVALPSKVKKIYSRALNNCNNLTSLTVDIDNEFLCSDNNVIYDKEKTILLVGAGGIENLVIPSGVTGIADYAFSNSKLRGLNLGEVKVIGDYAFQNCNIQALQLNDGLTSIGNKAFYGCKSVTTVNIPKSVTKIGYSAFDNSGILDMKFEGTVEEWNVIISKIGSSWIPDVDDFTIKCSNGNVVYNETTD